MIRDPAWRDTACLTAELILTVYGGISMNAHFAKIRIVSIIAILGLVLTACAPKPGTVTLEQYDKLKLGMKYDAVVEILGKPHQVQPFMGVKQCTWVNDERHIHAKFIAGRAVYYSSKGLKGPVGPPTSGPVKSSDP